MKEILVPIFICVVLPVSIVLIVYVSGIINNNKRAEVLIKAIESGRDVDIDRLAEAMSGKAARVRKNHHERQNGRLLKGCIFSLIGLISVIFGLCGFGSFNDLNIIPSGIGAILLAIGVSYLIVYYVSRKELNTESRIEAE